MVALSVILMTTSLALAGTLESASRQGKIVLRAEREIGGFVEQQALVFEGERVVFSRNSNFMCMPSWSVKLGVFTNGYDDNYKTALEQMRGIVARLRQPASTQKIIRYGSPHSLKLYIGSTELDPESTNARTVKRLLEAACDEVSWKADRAAEVLLDGRKEQGILKIQRMPSSDGQSQKAEPAAKVCKAKDGGILECTVPGFGKAFLQSREDQVSNSAE